MFAAPIDYSPNPRDLEHFSTHSSLVQELEMRNNQGVIVIAAVPRRIYVMLESQSQSYRLMQTRYIDLGTMNMFGCKETTENSWGLSWQIKRWNVKNYSKTNPSVVYNQFIEQEIPREIFCIDLDILPYHPVNKDQLDRFKEKFDEITGGLEVGTPHSPMKDISEALNRSNIQERVCQTSCTIS